MTFRFRWRKILRVAGIAILVLVAGLAGFVQFQQRVLRWRAERLLADIRAFQSHPETPADVERFLSRWSGRRYANEQCSQMKCDMGVELDDEFTRIYRYCEGMRWACRELAIPFALLGGRTTFVAAHFTLRDGKVDQSRFWIMISVAPNTSSSIDPQGYAIAAAAEQHVDGFGPFQYWSSRSFHREYWVGKRGGCEGCVKIESVYTPRVTPAQLASLTDFDLSCISRRRPCTTEGDLMPSAWRQYQHELPRYDSLSEDWEHCRVPLALLAEEYRGIVVANVLSVGNAPTNEPGAIPVRLRLVQVLKGAADARPNEVSNREAFDRGQGNNGSSSRDMQAGHRYILFASLGKANDGHEAAALEECGVVPFTPENLAAVKRGIARGGLADMP
jgi:hypothetical protein